MQLARKRLGAIALAACLLVAAAAFAVSAFADVPWQGEAYSGSITAYGTSDEEMAADLAGADVVVDVYRVATAQADGTYDTYNYTWADGFGTGAIDTTSLDASGWQGLADAAATAASGQPHVTGALGQAIDGLDDGLYLLLAHGEGVDPFAGADDGANLVARSAQFTYTFQPALVSIPTKEAGADGIATTDMPGEWLRTAAVALKAEREQRYGSVTVNKAVTGGTDAATFVFHLSGNTPAGEAYDNYASVYFDGQAAAPATVSHIPAGTRLEVTEVYSGARYTNAGGSSQSVTIVADDEEPGDNAVAVSFTNAHDESVRNGYGVNNRFELGDNGDWNITVTPQDANASTQG